MHPIGIDIAVTSLPVEWKVFAISLTIMVYVYMLDTLHRVYTSMSRPKDPTLGHI